MMGTVYMGEKTVVQDTGKYIDTFITINTVHIQDYRMYDHVQVGKGADT